MWQLERPESPYLDEEQTAALGVLFDVLIPPHAPTGLPGASAVGAHEYVSRLLAMSADTYREIPDWRELYTRGLAALESAARARGSSGLVELDDAGRVALLRELEAGVLEGFPADLDQARLFTTLRRHCVQGCFGDPRWGGNGGGAMWTWLGYPIDPGVR